MESNSGQPVPGVCTLATIGYYKGRKNKSLKKQCAGSPTGSQNALEKSNLFLPISALLRTFRSFLQGIIKS